MAHYFQFNITNQQSDDPVIYTEQVTHIDNKDSKFLQDPKDNSYENLTLSIDNISKAVLSALPLEGEPTENNYHFKLSFRSGVLSEDTIKNGRITQAEGAWKVSTAVTNGFGAVSFYFLNSQAGKWKPGKTLSFQLKLFTAVYSPRNAGDRLTELMLDASHFQSLPKAPNPIHEINTLDIRIKNFLVNRQLPIALSFEDHNTVLNEESASNQLKLQIHFPKRLAENGPKINEITFTKDSRLSIAFDAEPNASPPCENPWALSTVALLNECIIKAGDEAKWNSPQDGKPTKNPDEAEQAVWTFTPAKDFPLSAGEMLTFTISALQTGLPAGFTNLYLRYEDVPGYGSGSFTLPILKTPLVTRGEKVGIGTNLLTEMLHIGSKDNPGSLALAGDNSFLQIGVGVEDKPDTPDIGKIGYNTHGPGLNFYGGGANAADRKIQFYNEGGARFIGPAKITNDYEKAVDSSYMLQVDGDVRINQKLYVANEIILSNESTDPLKIIVPDENTDKKDGKSLLISAGSALGNSKYARSGGDLTLSAGSANYNGKDSQISIGSVKIYAGANNNEEGSKKYPANGGDIQFFTGGLHVKPVERMRIANNGDVTINGKLSLSGLLTGTARNITNLQHDLSIFCGESNGGWRQVKVGSEVENSQIEVTIDTSACNFATMPIYLTSIRGKRYMDWVLGANTIFTQSKDSFTVRLTVATYYYDNGWRDLLNNNGNLLDDANGFDWTISWIAIGRCH